MPALAYSYRKVPRVPPTDELLATVHMTSQQMHCREILE